MKRNDRKMCCQDVAAFAIPHERLRKTVRSSLSDSRKYSEERPDTTLWPIYVGFWEWEIRSGRVTVDANLADLTGYGLDELLARGEKGWGELLHPDDLRMLEQWMQSCRETSERVCRMVSKAGGWVGVLLRGRVVKSSTEGEILVMYGVALTMTAQAAETWTKGQQQMATTSRLMEGILHDCNNIISSMQVNFLTLKECCNEMIQRGGLVDTSETECKAPMDKTVCSRTIDVEMKTARSELVQELFEILNDNESLLGKIKSFFKALSSFTRNDDDVLSYVSIHNCIEEALLLARCKYKYHAELIKNLLPVPAVQCNKNLLVRAFVYLICHISQSFRSYSHAETNVIHIETWSEPQYISCSFSFGDKQFLGMKRSPVHADCSDDAMKALRHGDDLRLVSDIVVKAHQGSITVNTLSNGWHQLLVRLPCIQNRAGLQQETD